MKLYTINATPVRDSLPKENNEMLVSQYPSKVAELLESYDVDGFTIYEVMGYWKGTPEVSFKIEIAHDSHFIVGDICNDLRDKWDQEAVMLTLPNGEVEFI